MNTKRYFIAKKNTTRSKMLFREGFYVYQSCGIYYIGYTQTYRGGMISSSLPISLKTYNALKKESLSNKREENKAQTKSEIVREHAKKNGIKVKTIKLSKGCTVSDILGLPDVNTNK